MNPGRKWYYAAFSSKNNIQINNVYTINTISKANSFMSLPYILVIHSIPESKALINSVI
ncbi:MAG TPA: hypothetical protein V6D25_07935 [Leptolyngbyaceae cyanobacterium]